MLELTLSTMTCGRCFSVVTIAIKQANPRVTVEIDLANHLVGVESTEDNEIIAAAVAEAGYPATRPLPAVKTCPPREGTLDQSTAAGHCRLESAGSAHTPFLSATRREGSFMLDFLNFRRETRVTGWQFEGLLAVRDGVVLFRSHGGDPRTDRVERQVNPLGPLQRLGEGAGGRLAR